MLTIRRKKKKKSRLARFLNPIEIPFSNEDERYFSDKENMIKLVCNSAELQKNISIFFRLKNHPDISMAFTKKSHGYGLHVNIRTIC